MPGSNDKQRRLDRLAGRITPNGLTAEEKWRRVRKAMNELIGDEEDGGDAEYMSPEEQEEFFDDLYRAVRERKRREGRYRQEWGEGRG